MEYRNVICDECGTVRAYCSEYSDTEIEKILEDHPEWYLTRIDVR